MIFFSFSFLVGNLKFKITFSLSSLTVQNNDSLDFFSDLELFHISSQVKQKANLPTIKPNRNIRANKFKQNDKASF